MSHIFAKKQTLIRPSIDFAVVSAVIVNCVNVKKR